MAETQVKGFTISVNSGKRIAAGYFNGELVKLECKADMTPEECRTAWEAKASGTASTKKS